MRLKQLRRFTTQMPRRGASTLLVTIASFVGGFAQTVVLVSLVSISARLGGAKPIAALPFMSGWDGQRISIWVVSAAVFVMLMAHLANERLSIRLVSQTTFAVQRRMIRAYFRAKEEFRIQLPSTHLSESLSVLSGDLSFAGYGFISVLSALVTVAPALIVSVFINPLAFLVMTTVGVVISVSTRPLLPRIRRRIDEKIAQRTRLFETAADWTRLGREVHSFGISKSVITDLEDSAKAANQAQERARTYQRFAQIGRQDIVIALLVLTLALISRFRESEVASIGAVVIVLTRSLQALQGVQRQWHDVDAVLPSVELLLDRIEALEAARRDPGSTQMERFAVVEVKNLSFRYPNSDRLALEDISLTISHGEIVAVVGPSGGGKSTLIRLVLRLLEATSGQILVDGVEVGAVDDDDWARLVAGVPQEIELLDGTVNENIAFRRAEVGHDAVIDCARRANIHDEITALPNSYETRLGINGVGLSGGQRQRIAIARALVGSPHLLVLDEPTSALDAASEALICQTLQELRRDTSILVVAHRPQLVEIADRVLTITDGRIMGARLQSRVAP